MDNNWHAVRVRQDRQKEGREQRKRKHKILPSMAYYSQTPPKLCP
jgi:hypothetical protein